MSTNGQRGVGSGGPPITGATEAQPLYLHGSGAPPVFAFLHPGAHPRRKTAVLLCPPFGWEDVCSYRVRCDWAQQLAREGYTTLRIDLPGSGDSAGAPSDPGQLNAWTQAVDGAARWLRSTTNGDDDETHSSGMTAAAHRAGIERVVAVGIGLGGLIACKAALEGTPIEALAVWSVHACGRTLLRELRAFSAFEVANRPGESESRSKSKSKSKNENENENESQNESKGESRAKDGARGSGRDGDADESEREESASAYERELADDALMTNGYLMSAETVLDLRGLDLARLKPSPDMTLRRALLLGRDGMKVGDTLPEALRSAGIEVTVADGPGYGALMVEPQDAQTPIEVIERVRSWLDEIDENEREHAIPPGQAPREPRAPRRANDHDAAPHELSARAHTPGHSVRDTATRMPRACEEMVIECDGVELRERPLFLEGRRGQRLFGVLAEPLGARRELSALLVNAGPQRRIGPNRMWVEIARRWAARGVSTLRLDAAGIGDADGDASVLARNAEFYRPEYVEQACAGLQTLAELGLPPRFVTLGLCGGAYWSAHAALADERVVAAIMLNPRTLVFDEWRHTRRRAHHLKEKALRASTWRRVLTGEIQTARHVELAGTLLRRAANAPARARERISAPRDERPARKPAARGMAREPVEELFDALRERDQRGLLLFTGSEVLRRELTDEGVLARMDRWPNIELAIRGTSADTHTLTPIWLQRQVHELVDRVLDDELARLPDAASGAETRIAKTTTIETGTTETMTGTAGMGRGGV